jgi:NitT/TauT family transport system substrate-binding protein
MRIAGVPIVLIENFRAVFYAPFYAACALGEYQEEGLEVELKPAAGAGSAAPSNKSRASAI